MGIGAPVVGSARLVCMESLIRPEQHVERDNAGQSLHEIRGCQNDVQHPPEGNSLTEQPGEPTHYDKTFSSERKLAAIMFTDMVGFSRLMHQDEDRTLQLLEEHNRIIGESVANHQGRLLKTMGDAVFADFPSATSAVKCAIEIQTRLREFNEDKLPDQQIAIRIGIHLGDVIIRDDDIYGDGVNVAARLEPLSEPGGVCFSEAVYQTIKTNFDVEPVLIGEVQLKNIIEKQVVYKIPPLYGSSAPDNHSSETVEPQANALRFRVNRIEKLPPPERTPFSVAINIGSQVSVVFLISALLSPFLLSAFVRPYRIARTQLIDPSSITVALQQREHPAYVRVWESLNQGTRQEINSYVPTESEEKVTTETAEQIRSDLNRLIRGDELVFDDSITSELDLSQEVQDLIRASPTGDNLARTNRRLLEAAFSGTFKGM